MKIADNLTLNQANYQANKLKAEDRKLISLGGYGNWSSVEVKPTYQGGDFNSHGYTQYGVFVTKKEV